MIDEYGEPCEETGFAPGPRTVDPEILLRRDVKAMLHEADRIYHKQARQCHGVFKNPASWESAQSCGDCVEHFRSLRDIWAGKALQ